MANLERVKSRVFACKTGISNGLKRLGAGVGAAVLALAGGLALSVPAQAASGTINGGASLGTNGQCTAASPSSFGVSFTATFQSADTGSLDTYSLFLLDGTGTIIGSSSQSISASAASTTTVITAPTTQTPTDGSAYTLVAYNQNTGSPIYTVGDLYESDGFQMASLAFDASALDNSCPGPNSARPTPTITTAANPTNAPFVATITFDASVTGFDSSDLVVGNGAASAFAGSGASYSVTITPVVDGDVTVSIPAAAAVNGVGTESNAAPTLTVLYDETSPQPEFIDGEPDTTIEGPITVYLQFDEIVSGVASGQIGVTNAAISSFVQVSNQLYSFTLTPDLGQTNGAVVLTYDAAQVSDIAGNTNVAASQFYSANTDAPSVVVSTSAVEPVSGPFTVDVVFNEAVTGFDVGDFLAAGNFTVDSVAGSGTTYTAILTPTGSGTLSIRVSAAAVIDVDTNANTISNLLQVEADITAPSVAITTAEVSPVGASFAATITFSKPVVDFVVGDLVLTNATATDFSGSDGVYLVTILPVATGTVKVDIPAAVAQDAGGRDNSAAATLTLQADVVAPTLTMTSAAVGPVSAPFTLLLDFSETAVGFTLSDLTVVNGVASNLQRSGDDLTATITPTAVGTLTVDVADGAFQDTAGNDNTAVTQFSIASTANGAPTVVIASSTAAGLVSGAAFPVTVTFSEPVTGFLFDEIVIVNGTRSSESISGNVYSFTVTPIADGVVSVDVPAGVAQDVDLNANTAATQFSVTADTGAPTVAITSAAVAPLAGAFNVTLTFSEPMSSVVGSTLTVGNGSVTAMSGSGAVYTATILPTADGTVTVDVLAGAANDLAGNGNTAATQYSIAAVLGSPTLAITGPAGPLADAFTATFTFSENVTGFTIDDIVVSNGVASSFAGTGAVYTVTIVPVAAGPITVDVASGAAQNGGAINNSAAPQYSVTAASLGPIATITSTTPSITGAGFIPISVAFDEDVAGLAGPDFVVTGGGAPVAFGGAGSTYSFFVSATGGVDLVIGLPASSATAVAGGAPNRLGPDLVIPVAVVPSIPTVVIASAAADPVTASTFDLTVTFSEDVTGFTIADLSVSGGEVSTFSGSGAVYAVTIAPTRDGTLTVDIAGSAATSSTGGGNTAAAQFSITVNQQLPQPVITSALSGTVSGAFDIVVNFNEPVTGFDITDLTVGNGAASNFAGSGTAYTATITPAADGAVTVDIAAAAAVDVSAGASLVAAQYSITNDETGATPTLASAAADPFSGSFVLNVTFDEAVTGFAASDLTVGNGTASGLAGSGAAYTVTITPSASGVVTVDMAPGKVGDAAGNPNLVAAQFSITADITAPSGYAVSLDQDPINSGNETALSFSYTGFEVGATLDYTISSDGGGASISDSVLVSAAAGTISGLDGSGLGDGTVTLTAALTDVLGNIGADETDTATKDTAAPSVVLSSVATDPVSGGFTLDIVFSESVTGFAIGDLTVGNGAASAFAGAGTTYSATITPAADGAVTVDVAAAAAQDAAGNDNTAATQFSITNDETAPSVVLSTVSADPVAGAFTLDIVFSESVTGFAVGDLTVGNGAASAFAGSGTTYSATITPAGDGAVTVDVAAAAAQDSAGNDNTAATQFSITNDETGPSVVLSSVSTDPVSGAFTLDVVFSESVTGFAVGDLSVGNGAASAFAGSGDTYSVTITPAGDGLVTVDVAAAAAQDAAGNANSAATQFSITRDGTAPTVALSTVSADPVSGAFTLDIVFSESVTGFAVGDLSVGNGAASAFAGTGTTYSATITPSGDGAVTVDVAAAAAQDSAGNGNTAATQFSITNDETAPTLVLSTLSGDPVSGAFTLDVVFSESVTGFAAGDLTVGNGVASAFAGSGTTYSATITPSADGAVTVDVAAAAAQDSAGNDNNAATQFSITNDGTLPTLVLSTVSGDPVSGAFTLDIVFSESVTGFGLADLNIGNGAASALAGSGDTYSATITPAADGLVTVDVAAAAAQDSAGNDNVAASQFSITSDGTAPTVVLSTASSDPVSGAFTLSVVFSESVSGFGLGDLNVGNGAASAFAGAGTTYSATITPAGDGAVTVDVAAAAAQDSAGNDNLAASQFSITSDGTAPGLVITGPAGTQTGAFTASFTFTESVSGFAVGDIVVANGAASAFAGSGAAYTATITPAADGPVTVDVAAGVASDPAGNANTAASQLSINADISAPTVLSVIVSDSDLTVSDIGTSFTIAATFSEALDSAVEPDFAFVGADLSATLSLQSSAWSSGDTVYTASYDLLDSGLMADDIDVTVSGAADVAGNLLADSTTPDLFSVELRRGGITIAQTVEGAVDGEFDFTGDLGSFAIATSGQTGSRAFTDLIAGSYTITPAAEDGFSADGASCSGGTTSVDGTTGAVTIVLAPADSVTCTFAAIADPEIDETAIPTVELALDSAIDNPAGVSTSFSLSNTGGSPFTFTAATDVTWLDVDPTSGSIPAEGSLEFTITFNDGVLDLAPGSYTANITITETGTPAQKPLGASANTLNVVTIPVTITLQPREGTLTIIATTAPSQAGDGVFNYTSTLAQLDGLSLSTVAGTASSGALTVLRGTYSLTQTTSEGWALNSMSCTGDTDGGSTFDLDTGTMVIDLDPEESMVCTFANRRDEDFIREITQSAIRSFMAARADQILTNSPELSGRMRGSRMSATPNRFAADYADGRFSADLSTSLSAIRQAAENGQPQMPGATQFNLDGQTGIASLDVWAQATYTSIDDNRAGLDASSTFGLYYLGVDMMASEDLLVGALLQWDHAETVTGTYRSEVSGDGWLAGPYMVARLAENVYLDARGAWGRSENDVNPIGLYTDAFETSRWLVEANLTGEMTSGNWRLSPQIGIAYFNEEQDSYTDTLGFLIPSQEITLGRINAGPELAYRFVNAEGGYFEPYVRLTALWDYDDADVYNAAGNLQGIGGLRADARFGLTAELPNGGLISGEIGIIGLGLGDFEANNAMLRIRLPLSME
ncbi:hypothetical protein SAMN04488568_101271 [Maricaulis salignorans]|uniref:Autotransporter domain-containing protein n=1 Tax=Maricaulis salignorans TaxID=144026 RepID=A0A1G9M101_9PROT|nr:hypothetical protein SAMN04488568_101271 [Maricaulis salignorans]